MNEIINFEDLPFVHNGRVKRNTWNDIENHKRYYKWLGKKLEYEKQDDWYRITCKLIQNNGGGGLLKNYYSNSPSLFVKVMFHDREWYEWLFDMAPNIWNDIENHKRYFKWLGEKLEYEKPEDWYRINKKLIHNNNGGGLLKNYYSDSPSLFVKKMFPDLEWYEWLFDVAQIWKDIKNHKRYFKWLGEKLEYEKPEDWYRITYKSIYNNSGGGLLKNYYSNSPSLFVKVMFHDREWYEWLFDMAPNIWNDIENHKRYFKWLGEKLEYEKPEDWYRINKKLIHNNSGGGLLHNYYSDSPSLFVKKMFPDREWKKSKFHKNYSQGQIEWTEFLKITILDIRNALNHDDGEYKIPNSKYHADGYSEKENTIFEYHGDKYHGNPKLYDPEEIFFNISYKQRYIDTLKKQDFCEKSGYKFYFIWESEWNRGKKAIRQLQRKFKQRKQRQ